MFNPRDEMDEKLNALDVIKNFDEYELAADEMKEQIDELKEDVIEQDDVIKKHLATIERRNSHIKCVQDENEALKIRNSQLETRCKYLLEGVDTKQTIIDQLSTLIDLKDERIYTKQGIIDKLSDKIDEQDIILKEKNEWLDFKDEKIKILMEGK